MNRLKKFLARVEAIDYTNKGTLALAITSSLLIGIVGLRQNNSYNILKSELLVDHTHEVISNIDRINYEMSRGKLIEFTFYVSKEAQYVEMYRDSIRRLYTRIDDLERLTDDNNMQRYHIQKLRKLIDKEVDFVEDEITRIKAGGIKKVNPEKIRRPLNPQINELVETIREEESRLLVIRNSELRNNTLDAVYMATVASAINIIILIIIYIVIHTETKKTRKRELALQEKAGLLSNSNEELEKFAYTASHDLQEPLRKIQAFIDRLESKVKPTLDSSGLVYLDRIKDASARMSVLIDDLLRFSRVTSKGEQFVVCNLNECLVEVLSNLELTIEEKAALVTVDKLPNIEGDCTQIKQLFQNLISNALKFSKKDVRPEVEIVYVNKGNIAEFVVRDNGIGFDEKYSAKIFELFERLHGRSEYEGTGIGLALCKKIVLRHGGSITASSIEGIGSTFTIRLPIKFQQPI